MSVEPAAEAKPEQEGSVTNTEVGVFTVSLSRDITADDIGVQLSADTADKQAAMFLAFAQDVMGWSRDSDHSWHQQCRSIAEELSDTECVVIAGVLGPLIDHLQGIPAERRTAAVAEPE